MKIYGNARSDGFSFFLAGIAGLFVVGGFLLAHVSDMTLAASLVALAALVAAMVVTLSKWDVMSDAPKAAGADLGMPIRLPSFPMKADTEAVSLAAALPSVDKPKSMVETNTAVA